MEEWAVLSSSSSDEDESWTEVSHNHVDQLRSCVEQFQVLASPSASSEGDNKGKSASRLVETLTGLAVSLREKMDRITGDSQADKDERERLSRMCASLAVKNAALRQALVQSQNRLEPKQARKLEKANVKRQQNLTKLNLARERRMACKSKSWPKNKHRSEVKRAPRIEQRK